VCVAPQVICSLQNSAEFTLQSHYLTEYTLNTAIATFDRETRDLYTATIKCSDQGQVVQTSIVPVTVRVMDDNDNDPVFERKEYRTSISENNVIGK